jgi:hypothetical protein
MRGMRISAVALAGLVGVLLVTPDAGGTIRHVPTDYPTIQAGIDACAPGDTVLVGPGDYYENIDFFAHTITVASQYLLTHDPGMIDVTHVFPMVASAPLVTIAGGQGRDAILCGFTIAYGIGLHGHGVCCLGTSPTITHNRITSCCAGNDGGGIYVEYGGPLIEYNRIDGN